MVNIYKVKLTGLQQGILRLLYVHAGASLNARNIAKLLEVTPPAVSKAVPGLEKMDLINVTKDKESKRYDITLNRENQHAIWLKRADNLKLLVESGIVRMLHESLPGATVVLFGSYAFGEDTITSDVDLAVIGAKDPGLDMSRYSRLIGREIIINYYPSWTSIDQHLKNNILNGIIIRGGVSL